ncbi:calmodulin-binding protein [Kitasatospora sp. NPDC093806]|uniref:BP74-related protein n=1 Tax=Kitasatospora sp. NPDC093806 TaxID=3155075 RepID=UPI003439FF72
MRRIAGRIGSLAAAAVLALTMAQPAGAQPAGAQPAGAQQRTEGPGTRAPDPTALFEFTDVTHETFVFRLTDVNRIQKARDILSGKEKEATHVMARIVPRPQFYNPRWSYHINPDTVEFFAFAIEVCDATIPYIEEHLDEAGGAFLPGYYWCGWSTKLTREIIPS